MFRLTWLLVAVMLGPSYAATQTISVTPNEMRSTAFGALQDGQPARALALGEALLLRAADDPIALRIAGQAALEIRLSDVAVRHGRMLYQIADDNKVRFFAARLVALAHAQQKNYTRSKIWLRRARQVAPDAATAASIAQDYATLRQHNPLSFNFDFGVQPSSNINNGSSESTYERYGQPVLFLGQPIGLTPSAQSLSGYQFSADATVGYTVNENANSRTVVSVTGQMLRYALSNDAKAAAPTFDVGNLAYDRAVLGVRHDWRVGEARQPLTAVFKYAVSQINGEFYARDVEFDLLTQWLLNERTRVRSGVRLGQVTYAGTGNTSESWALDLGWNRALGDGDAVIVRGSVGRTLSDDAVRLNSDRQDFGITYNFGRVADVFDVSLGLGRQWRSFKPSATAPDGRTDLRTDVTLTVGLPLIEFYGFSPIAKLEAYQTNSNVSRFQSDGLSVDVSIRSNF